MVQWLRIRLPLQGTQSPPLVQEDPTCRRAAELVGHSCWSPCLLEPVLRNKRSPCTATRERSLLASTRENPHAATKIQHSQNNFTKKILKTWLKWTQVPVEILAEDLGAELSHRSLMDVGETQGGEKGRMLGPETCAGCRTHNWGSQLILAGTNTRLTADVVQRSISSWWKMGGEVGDEGREIVWARTGKALKEQAL